MIDLKKYRGSLWRKMHEKKEVVELPGFHIEEIKEFTELPFEKDITKIDVKYPLIPPFAYAHIKWDPTIRQLIYNLQEPKMTDEEKNMTKKAYNILVDMINIGLTSAEGKGGITEFLEKTVKNAFKSLGISLTSEQYTRFMYFIYRDFVGLNEIEPLIKDPWLEDIGCDGLGVPLFVVHRRYGSVKTNIVYDKLEDLRDFVVKLAERCGRYVSYAEPILDGTLPDGSRVNANLAGDVTTRGPTISIRKFSERPFSPINVIELGTASPEVMAYFWYLVESGVSLLIAGGVATGKTTLLNSISMFIPPEAKIVSIEDTRELRLPHEHWIPTVSRLGFGIPMPTGEKYGEVTLFDLLKGSFRQNPDYVIVGEVRGNEAYVMFQGMSSGHPSMSTFHAGSVDTVIKRLTTSPIDLSASLVESLDAIVILVHAKERGKSARRIKEIEEIKSVDSKTLEADTHKAVEWDPGTDSFKVNISDSIVLHKIATNKGLTYEDVLKEVEKRKIVLLWMLKNGMKDFEEVGKIINDFYKNPKELLEKTGKLDLEKITKELEVKKEEVHEETKEEAPKIALEEHEEVLEEMKKERKLLNIFGYKIVKERVPAA